MSEFIPPSKWTIELSNLMQDLENIINPAKPNATPMSGEKKISEDVKKRITQAEAKIQEIKIFLKTRLRQPEEVEGFNKLLPDNQKLFKIFLTNFYERWEFPEEHLPKKVYYTEDKESGPYLRVDFENGGWLHVTSPTTWW